MEKLERWLAHDVASREEGYLCWAGIGCSTRHSPWSSVMKFIESQPIDSLGADIGCGNGKYLLASSKYYSNIKVNNSSTSVQDNDPLTRVNFIPIAALERSSKLAEIVYNRGKLLFLFKVLFYY
ncbi:unnamed protein product [Trichobilharzia regenti]|nr:unnamed protein product [Trichobilharzia regenti]